MRAIVIGAGVLGASTAYHLARDGAAVAIVDQAHDGRATAAGAGIISPWASRSAVDPDWYRLANAGAGYYPELVGAIAPSGEALSYARVGALSVSADRGELDAVEAAARANASDTPAAGAIRRLTAAEAQALFPPLRADLAAVLVEGGARVDGRSLAAALLDAAQRHGATLHRGAAVPEAQGGRIRGARVGAALLEADIVVVAAGAWATALLAPFGIALPVEPQRGQITHLRLPGVDTRRWPVVSPTSSSHYMVAFDDSRVVVGATRETGAGFDYRVTAAGQAEVLNQALAVAPGLAAASVIETRIGFRPLARDNRPILAAAPGVEGLLIGNGLGATGLTIGPYAGRLLAELALGRTPAVEMRPYAVGTRT
jgi:D-amino-acid dehydrogenase